MDDVFFHLICYRIVTDELQGKGYKPDREEFRELMENVQKLKLIDDEETYRKKDKEKQRTHGTKRKSDVAEGIEGPARESPYTPSSGLSRLPIQSETEADASPHSPSAFERFAAGAHVHTLIRFAAQHLGHTLTEDHFQRANRNHLPAISDHERVVVPPSLQSWVEYEALNITAGQFDRLSWRGLIRALQAFYRSARGETEVEIMQTFLVFMGVENLDLDHMHQDDVMWIVQAIEASFPEVRETEEFTGPSQEEFDRRREILRRNLRAAFEKWVVRFQQG